MGSKYFVNIFKSKPQDDHLDIRCNSYLATIPKSYIEKYDLTVNSNNMFISKELYEDWFKEGIKADRERARKAQETFDSFYSFIPLFWANREMILNEPRYYSVKPPLYFWGAVHSDSYTVTLGELLQIWNDETILSSTCKKCGGKSGIFQFGGSLLSGTIMVCRNICLQCGEIGHGSGGAKRLSELVQTRVRYKPLQPISEESVSYEELVAVCKSKLTI